MIKKITTIIVSVICYGCVIWQALSCYHKYVTKPSGASFDIINTKDVGISLSFCKVVDNLNRNYNGTMLKETIEPLVELNIKLENGTLYLKNNNETAEFEFITSMPEPYLCKEFKLPKKEILFIEIYHNAYDSRNFNFHLFIHPTNMIYKQEFVIQYPNTIFHKPNDGISNLRIESYDLTTNPVVTCGNSDYHECKSDRIVSEYNKTLGCTYPLKK